MGGSDNGREEHLDAIDRALVTALQEDGRIGYSELAEMVGLTAGGVRRRVVRLQERGVIQIVGVTDPLKLGYRSMAMIGIEVRGSIEPVVEALGRLDAVIYVVTVSGAFDLLVEVLTEDSDDLYVVISQQIKTIDGVARTETFQYFGIHTHRFAWGAPS